MLVRHFDPDRREMMVVMLKAVQGTVPSAEAPSAEACFSEGWKSSLVYFFYFCGARVGKQDCCCSKIT